MMGGRCQRDRQDLVVVVTRRSASALKPPWSAIGLEGPTHVIESSPIMRVAYGLKNSAVRPQ